jgi:hypothetical protein
MELCRLARECLFLKKSGLRTIQAIFLFLYARWRRMRRAANGPKLILGYDYLPHIVHVHFKLLNNQLLICDEKLLAWNSTSTALETFSDSLCHNGWFLLLAESRSFVEKWQEFMNCRCWIEKSLLNAA